MKPTSVIFLIVAAVLIVAGIITCGVAKGMADSQGVELFLQHSEGENKNIIRYEITADNINKIKIELKDANINVYKSEEDVSYIELINFNINSYSYSTDNSVLTIDDTQGIMAILNLTNNGVQFNGLRHYINFENFTHKDKSVNIYLIEEDSLKVFSAVSENGNMSMSGFKSNLEYEIKLESGDLYIENIETSGNINASVNNGNLNLKKTSAASLDVSIGNGSAELNDIDEQIISYKLYTNIGNLTVKDKTIENREYIYSSPVSKSNINIKVDMGNITLK